MKAGIALFDLDYTLLGGDATYEWIHFLVGKGAIDGGHIALLDEYYEDYGKGTLDIVAFLHFDFGALASHPRAKMEAWREEYLAQANRADHPAQGAGAHRLARGERSRDRDRHCRQQFPHRPHLADDRRRASDSERSRTRGR